MLSKMQKADIFCGSTEINRDVFAYKKLHLFVRLLEKIVKIGDISSAKKINDHIRCVHMGFHGFHLQQNK